MKLFEPLDINGMVIQNRTLVPAMVTRLSGEDGYVNQAIIDRYVRYAQGEIGLIIVEATAIHGSRSGPLLRLSEDRFIDGHRELVRRVHETSGSKIVPQIIHFMKVARSGWRQTFDMLSVAEIEQIIDQFGDAAARVREAGYDGLEIHCAHAYTLASSVSRLNKRRDDYDGRTLEGRLRLFGRVYERIRSKVGDDFPVGARFLAEESIKDGYTLPDAKLIALRMAQMGVDYINLSVGGKFEDCEKREGQPPYPYTGYSGDRCMPADWYQPMPHVHLAAGIKTFINEHGYRVPVVSVGKISDPADAEMLLQEGKADIIGMARQLLADPDWPKKVREGRSDEIVRCIYCNVCKTLDENFKEVTCFLWPKHARQAPPAAEGDAVPHWAADGGALRATVANGTVKLGWRRAQGAVAGYDVYRIDGDGPPRCVEAVKGTKFDDATVLGGLSYSYFVRAFDASGRASGPSQSVRVDVPLPDYIRRRAGAEVQKQEMQVEP
jgi:2,4-dienoyl-CoA reductase-like NADH-dependent reductase (Old Yellow Enzyme family)